MELPNVGGAREARVSGERRLEDFREWEIGVQG